ncbi:MAG: transketolase C-terminal domain-containing protein, partial [Patescibacteria group bacterium]
MLNKKLNLSISIFGEDIKKEATRDGFGSGLIKAGEQNKDVVALSADLGESMRLKEFSEKFPERFFEAGVAEQAMITVASGLANYGKIPFATTYACFSPARNWEQIRTTIAINNFPVKIVGGHAGVNTGQDGVTHQSLEDIALMRVLPNMTVICPSDSLETQKAVLKSLDVNGPVYIRVQKYPTSVYTTVDTPFEIGKANVIWESRDPQVAIIGCGPIVYEALLAAKELDNMGIETQVINMHTVKPI